MHLLLNDDQLAALNHVQRRQNIFLTGPAGSGKSTLVRAIVEWAATERFVCDVTALTACAALLLGCKAKTLHSWAGIGLGRGSVDALVADIQKSPFAKKRWTRTDILVIDEISMMTPDLFDKLDAVGRRIRRRPEKPWGGLQLVVCGDFFQLPPVSHMGAAVGRFAFDAPAWKTAEFVPVLLTRIERQTDRVFQKVLNEARVGALSPESVAILESRRHLDWKSHTIRPTLLFSRNADVDTINEANLTALKKPVRVFEATTVLAKPEDTDPSAEVPSGEVLERLVARLDNDASYAPHLELCVGCQVMLVYNKDQEAGLVNGSRGVIVGFRDTDGVPIVQFLHGDPVAVEAHEWQSHDAPALKRLQIPLRVAYAVTIHKSQGATLDCALVDIGSSTFECGQAYVALSRVRNLESLYVWNFNPARVRADARVVAFYEKLAASLAAQAPQLLTQDTPGPQMPVPEVASPTPSDDARRVPQLLPPKMHESWRNLWESWLRGGGQAVLDRVEDTRKTNTIFPPPEDTYTTFQVPLNAVKVVILAQDPYHGPGQAMGVAFGVRAGVALPPSLKNIRKEFVGDVGSEAAWPAATGDLTPWLSQGVFLLNTTLTVEKGKANSHAKIGWDTWTLCVLRGIVEANPHVVFVAWGRDAQTLVKRLGLRDSQTVLEAAHPSPLSAAHGFFGSRPFTGVNKILMEKGMTPVDWRLTCG